MYQYENTFVHPDFEKFNFLVKKQEELKELKRQFLEVARTDAYKIGGGGVYDRWDTVRARSDIEAGKTKLPADFFVSMRRLVDAEFPAKHKFDGRGVELSPGDRPMSRDNILVRPEDGGIPAAVTAAGTDGIVVSKDVWGQLEEEQREALAEADGIHQYSANDAAVRVTAKNPTGFWPTGSGDYGVEMCVRPGVNRVYTLRSVELTAKMQKMIVGDAVIEIGTTIGEFYGLKRGRYRLSTSGVTRIGECNHSGMTEPQVRKLSEPFTLRDKVGYHGGDVTQTGECSWKVDGIYCELTAIAGRATLRFRNGEMWSGPMPGADIKASFELVGETLYLLYVRNFKRNNIPVVKKVQDYFRACLEFSLYLGPRELRSTMCIDSLPRDGIVIWGSTRHTFYKEVNTVDITLDMARALQIDHDVYIDATDEMVEGEIYEMAVKNCITLEHVRRDGLVVPRPPLSKVLPNKMKNVLATLKDPNLDAIRRYHKHAANDKAHGNCQVCRYL